MADTGTGTTGTAGTGAGARTAAEWRGWQESWDRQQEWYLPDREERFRIMLDMVEATVGPAPRVLDLACGTGSITARVVNRFPGAVCTGVDLDPALLTIARGTFAGDERVSFVTADLTDPGWPGLLPYATYDAVLTATALHWIPEEPLAALYGRLAGVVGAGGVLMNADHMPDPATPRINEAERVHRLGAMERARAAGAVDWPGWWELARRDPVLAGPAEERFRIFGEHEEGDAPSLEWHVRALRAAGFGEARAVWASPSDSLVLALK
ncbi:class I SAM-dependent methyltransferase [Streptomyces sp. NPDC093085]|uniref:class I SAM-dependent methyltransferase n=1 Tax=Streptomyces sp. NPDC093085 TaxID=3155068 RepID=UPI00342F56BF